MPGQNRGGRDLQLNPYCQRMNNFCLSVNRQVYELNKVGGFIAVSVVVFYIPAAQCLSTIAIVRRETNSRKWPT
jgi:hypothetical protein